MDPFLVVHALPVEPRAWFLGSAPSTFTTRWREALVHRLGGLLPGLARRDRRRPARRVGARGRRQWRRVRPDARGDGQRTGRPDRAVPGRLGGDRAADRRADRAVRDGRHRGALRRPPDGRRGSCPPTRVGGLLGPAGTALRPAEGTRAELDLARELSAALAGVLGPVVAELWPRTVDPPSHPRRLRQRLTWLFLRPGRLDRDDPRDQARSGRPPRPTARLTRRRAVRADRAVAPCCRVDAPAGSASSPRSSATRSCAGSRLAYLLFAFGEWSTWVAVIVYAYGRGGAGEAGLVVFVELAPSLVLAPAIAGARRPVRTRSRPARHLCSPRRSRWRRRRSPWRRTPTRSSSTRSRSLPRTSSPHPGRSTLRSCRRSSRRPTT